LDVGAPVSYLQADSLFLDLQFAHGNSRSHYFNSHEPKWLATVSQPSWGRTADQTEALGEM
jgi:hypothetical protein